MPWRPPRAAPDPDETRDLVASLREAVETARAREAASPPRFGPHGGVLRSEDRSRRVRVEIDGASTRLAVVGQTGLIVDEWTEATVELLARLEKAGRVDYAAVVTASRAASAGLP